MYTVFGFDDMFHEYTITCDSFVKAVKLYAKLAMWDTVFIRREKSGTMLYLTFPRICRISSTSTISSIAPTTTGE